MDPMNSRDVLPKNVPGVWVGVGGWVMQEWGGVGHGGVVWGGVRWDGSCRGGVGWVMYGWGGVVHAGVGWVAHVGWVGLWWG